MKTIVKKIRAAWDKLPPRVQSAVRAFVYAALAVIALTAKPLLPSLWSAIQVGDYETAKAIIKGAYAGIVAGLLRVLVPLAIIYAKAIGVWSLQRISGAKS